MRWTMKFRYRTPAIVLLGLRPAVVPDEYQTLPVAGSSRSTGLALLARSKLHPSLLAPPPRARCRCRHQHCVCGAQVVCVVGVEERAAAQRLQAEAEGGVVDLTGSSPVQERAVGTALDQGFMESPRDSIIDNFDAGEVS